LVRRAAVERQEGYHDLGGIAETEPQDRERNPGTPRNL
jgi:hypothetical protein